MPVLADFECKQGHVTEDLVSPSTKRILCPHCGGRAKRIITMNHVNTANEDAPWLKSVREVVDTSSTAKPEAREFYRNPTRSNWRAWQKAEKIRPMEPGEERNKPVIREVSVKKLAERHMKRMAIEVRGS